jgi:hypothetical protein
MKRSFALTIAVLMGLGLLSMSLAQAQDAYGGVASVTGGEVSIRAPQRPVVKRYAAAIRENLRRLRHPYSRRVAWHARNPGISTGQLTLDASKNMPSFDDRYQRHLGVLDTLRR